jgi:hypothetical protein
MEAMCGGDPALRDLCTISDLPILKEMFMPNGELPKYVASLPDPPGPLTDDNLATVTAIPTIYTLRHFGTNQISVLDLLGTLLNAHLFTPDLVSTDAFPDGAGTAPPSIPRFLFEFLFQLGLGEVAEAIGAGIINVSDDLVLNIIYQYILNADCEGPSFPLVRKLSSTRASLVFAHRLLYDNPNPF